MRAAYRSPATPNGNCTTTGRDGTTVPETGTTLQSLMADPAIAQPNSWALPFNTPPPVQAVPPCPAGKVVTFNPGTYNDAAALSTLMNGSTCPGRVFWFKPGQYYFNFSNSGSHEWAVNDGLARIIGGQPNLVVTGGSAVGPTLWTAQTAASSTFATPDNARVTDGATSSVQLGNATTGPTNWDPNSSVEFDIAAGRERRRDRRRRCHRDSRGYDIRERSPLVRR